jgi:hypothetical protein
LNLLTPRRSRPMRLADAVTRWVILACLTLIVVGWFRILVSVALYAVRG